MDFLVLLKSQNLDLLQIFAENKLDHIKKSLDEIISNSNGYEELRDSPIAYNNFFRIVSQIYLIEQNRLQNSVKADDEALSTKSFKKEFEEKVTKLANEKHTSNVSE